VRWFRFPRVLGVAACVFFLFVSASLVAAKWGDHQWARTAGRPDGTVVQLVPRPFLGSNRAPRGAQGPVAPVAPVVEHTVNGVQQPAYAPQHGEVRRRYHVGGPVTVLYDRDDPQIARLDDEGRYGLLGLAAIFVLTSLAVAAGLIATRKINYVGPRANASGPTRLAQRAAS